MSRYIGPVCRLCRREGIKLFLKGQRCFTKCVIDKSRAAVVPGQHGGRRTKLSEYSKRLRQKQIARRMSGVMERQFRRYFHAADSANGITGENLLRLLETRLDNVVRRLGFADSLAFARQVIIHGHVRVNGHKVTLPSYQVEPGDIAGLDEKIRNNPGVHRSLQDALARGIPVWLELDGALINAVKNSEKGVLDLANVNVQGKVRVFPDRSEMSFPVNEQFIVELYSK